MLSGHSLKRGAMIRTGKNPGSLDVDLAARAVTVHRNPEKEAYTAVTSHGPTEALEASALPGLRIPVGEIL